ncbi:FAD/NAD(P)-binding domain-containing protein [Xylona heveae TC161]|uniref:FAD/NAD(P)-binding domain-containing protein n=1 Tax=Xylona heveae (strain CBS 132557 / TC161) TaxID=1328760 RepID=A0A165FHC5_XYLHT|nr:FAD/NAD(P)-binding domain-containing protein [Xylona heveae TC161]KZF20981.1 FAD/NAD(P)-binding domain-containing protein [Xylona heveae TC161]
MSTLTESSRPPLRVAIVGAGPGGLVLAQTLRQDKRFVVTVYERGAPEGNGSSLVGFRILVTPAVLDSLREQLPSKVRNLVDRAVGIPKSQGNRVCLMDETCAVKCRVDLDESRSLCSISRWKLRNALLHGCDDFVKFHKEFKSYEESEDGVNVHFANSESIQCDLLIGADGAGSRVRKQLLPNSSRSDSGVTVIYFKAPFTPETEAMIPWASGCLAMTPRKSMVVAYYKNPAKPYGTYDLENIDPEDSFLMLGMGCYTNEFFNQSKHPDAMTPEELKDECLARAQHWHPLLRSLIAISVPKSVYVSHIKTQDPIDPWETGKVTIMGDAAHSMTPYLGKGATSAIADALALAEALKSNEKEQESLTERLAAYEKSMLERGFENAKKSMFVHQLVFAAGNTPWRAWLRNWALYVLDMFIRHPVASVEPFPVSYSDEIEKAKSKG